jgi:amino acid adenylation domain-containing protein
MSEEIESAVERIAVVGMAGRFPGADDLGAFWRNLCAGVESITSWSRQELAAAGVDAALLDDSRYVRAAGALRGIDLFDAAFFGFSPREAELLDPQQRLFLECAWEALESSGHAPGSFAGSIGIFAGMGMNGYLIHNLLGHPELLRAAGPLQIRIFNDANYLASLAAYKLDLTGPSVTVQTACSTSLVAVCMACQSLLHYQCDAALAGGVSITVPHRAGYLAQEGITSPDGHCRAFDAAAQGTLEGSGAGLVVLKRLSDALADGDTIHAVIRGFATNNDGAHKMSFTAPSIDGQIEVVAMAHAMAGVPPDSITYVEAHGTGTPLGDPVEVAALTEVFAAATSARGFCALGSVKTNIGHLDAAAGIASLIKAVLAVEHGVIPPSLHFTRPNPRIDFAGSPFYVNTGAREWRPEGPRRAGVSSTAIGGVNAHLVIEEPPAVAPSAAPAPWQLLLLSARTETALERSTAALVSHLRRRPELNPSDVAYTLQVGRRPLRHRRALVYRDLADAVACLEEASPRRVLAGTADATELPIAFLFPGLGNHYAGMAEGLYRHDAGFRERIDDCAERLLPELGLDLRGELFPAGAGAAAGESSGIDLRAMLRRGTGGGLERTALSQPAVFVVEYALASRLMDWGVEPQALCGFSVGEYVAACLAGVFSLDDALRLVARRARLIDGLPGGAMLAVPLGEEAARAWCGEDLSLAAVNGPELTVLAGPEAAVAGVEARLARAGLQGRRLQTAHAFHSAMMEPVVGRFVALFDRVELSAPEIPFLSNVTGTWIRPEEATDPAYWGEHLRRTVRFADGLRELWAEPGRVLVEVGPGQTLCSWALQHPAAAAVPGALALPTLRHAYDRQDDLAFLLSTLGRLWLGGQRIRWEATWSERPRRRLPLPTYPFERQRHWVEPAVAAAAGGRDLVAAVQRRAGEPPRPAPASADRRPAAEGTAGRSHPRPPLHVPCVAPRNAAEERIVRILGEILRVEPIGVHDSFFDLGGDSLLATRLVGLLNEGSGLELSLRSIFEAPTAAELAVLAGAPRERAASGWIEAQPRDGSPLPLSFAQQRLWFLDQLEPGGAAYNVPAAVLLRGPLDPRTLAASLDEVAARHEALRTTFGPAEEPAQRIAPPAAVAFPRVDLDGLPSAQGDGEARRLAVGEALRPFDLERGPLLRATLLRLGRERHVALLTLHHIVGDGWSSGLLVHEVAELYPALAAGRPSPLAPLPVQYADYAVWQREHLRGDGLEAQLAFWRQALAGAPPALELPADRPRPARASGRGALRSIPLAVERVQALTEIGRAAGTTPFMTLLAVFLSLLHRYTGETDLVVGTPVANRPRPELAGMIGFFANTLALRTVLPPGEPTFAGLLARVREAALAAYAYQELPFERLVEELAPERSLARTPLFQVMFLLHGTPFDEIGLPGLTLAPFGGLEPAGRAAKFDLTLELLETGPSVFALLELRRDLFDEATGARMLEHFAALLESAAAHPEGKLAGLPMLGEAESHQLTVEWSAGGGDAERAGCLHHAFEARAREAPEAPALVSGLEVLTYGELDARADRLARRLRTLGVGPEVPVGVCSERSFDLIAGLLAVLKAGGAYLPLDPAYPRDRLAFLLADAAAPVLLAPPRLAELLPAGAVRVSLEDPESGGGTGGPLPPLAAPDHLAYLIYTSGSTGRPKGVEIRHGAAAALVRWAAQAFSPAELDGVLFATSICFDLSVFELFVPLSLGGRVILAANALELPSLAAAGEVRLLNTVPSVMAELVHAGAVPPAVRTVCLAGEPLSRDLVDRLYAAAPGVERVLNLYGPSETTTYSTFALAERRGEGAPSIGRPIAGTWAHVLDAALTPVPIGVPGELFLGGAGLARGYLGRSDLTAERWLPDPFGEEAGGRLYRTGDRVRRRPDGRLDFLGRGDRQVKVRGFRIEPGEIEAALGAHPAVAQVAVVAQEVGERRLVAWLTRKGAADLSSHSLRAFLHARLPEFMVPSVFAEVDELPRNANGKIDRGALARRSPEPPEPSREERELTPLEEGIAALLAEVLGRERVDPAEDFFDIGGHSLLAARVMSRLRALFGVDLPVRSLFETPTVAGLAAAVAGAAQGGTRIAVPPLVPVSREGALPLSFEQQRLWFLDRLEPGSAAYNIPAPTRLTGTLDRAVLAACLREVVTRHEALRTTFPEDAGEAAQRIAPPPDAVELPLLDLAGLPAARRAAEARRLVQEEAVRPFDLAHGPVVRGALVRLAEREHVGLFTLHHIVSDGWSAGILLRELAALYAALAAGRPSPLAPLPVQYADFAVWQRAWLRGEVLERQLRFWRERLAGAPAVLELPADRPRPAVRRGGGGLRVAALPAELTLAVAGLARQARSTRFMVLLAAWKALLHRLTGQPDLLVGTPVANRVRVEVEGLIGFFANTLVLRTDLRGGAPGLAFAGLLARVRETALAAYAHQELPFEKLVEELAPERSLSETPLFQVLFVLQDVPARRVELPGLVLEPVPPPGGAAKFDLTLFVAASDAGLLASLEHSSELFTAAAADRLLQHFAGLLAAALEAPDRPLADLPFLSPAERHQLLVEWRASGAAWRREACVLQLFEGWAGREPHRTALLATDADGGVWATWTYGEVERRASRLARRLRALGAGPEIPVAVCLERGGEAVVSLLAVLKAGACYLPLDPAYPADRLRFMLADSGAPIVVARSGPDWPAEVCVLDPESVGERSGGALPAGAPLPDQLAYVVYTSGSTGRPKGVALPHRTLANLVAWQIATSEAPAGRTLQLASLSFDVSLQEILATWGAGGSLVVVPEEIRRDPAGLLHLLRAAGVERLFLPYVALQQLAEAADGRGVPATLREVITAGEALQITPEIAALFRRLPGCVLRNQYGPSETHVATELAPLGADGRDPGCWPSLPPIGRPVANMSLHVLDARLHPVPLGIPGEICLGGEGLARGYLGRPELTAERFVPHPWERGGRLYRTGDLARFRPDGEVEFLGRIDHQVKIRGHRVETGEIEAVLAAHPAVREAVVVARGMGAARHLTAWVLPAGPAVPVRELRDFLAGRLPDYMVPAVFAALPELPLTPSGKVDRAALSRRDLGSELSSAAAPPRTQVEEVLAGIWGEMLGLASPGRDTEFFESGGHSLLATRTVSRVSRAFGIEIGVRSLFEAPTPARLAYVVEAALRRPGAAPPSSPIGRRPHDPAAPLPLSFAQRRLWLLEQLAPGGSAYHIAGAVRLAGRLHPGALGAALGEVIRRHEALRTTFAADAGEPFQRIAPVDRLPSPALPEVDLTALPPRLRQAETERLAAGEARRTFDLERGPLARFTLLRAADREHVLLFTFHHIAADGWSLGVLLRELGGLYPELAAGRAPALPPPAVQYSDFTLWQRDWLRGAALEAQLRFWRERLAGLSSEPVLLPDRPRTASHRPAAAVRLSRLSGELTAALSALGRRAGATLFMVLLAAWKTLLFRSSGQTDLAVGSPVANRQRAEIEDLIGFFVNTLVLRTDLRAPAGEGLAFDRLLALVREGALAAYAHQDLPFERLVEEMAPERATGRTPLFQVMFALQNTLSDPLALPGLELSLLTGLGSGAAAPKFDMTLAASERGAELELALEIDRGLFDPTTGERLLGHFAALLAAVAASPAGRLDELPLLGEAERSQLLAEWRGTLREGGDDVTVPGRFAVWVRRSPGAVALDFDGGSLTYAELDLRANRLARRLLRSGLHPEDRVGVAVERSAGMVVAVLAILKAGGAYVPLDPALPAERLEWMASDAGLTALVAARPWLAAPPRVPVIHLEREEAALAAESPADPWPGGRADQLAYLMYTSGSTGVPKGVAVVHRGIVRLATNADYAPLGPGDRVAQIANASFDAATFEIWGALLSGARLTGIPWEVALSAGELARALAEREVTALFLTTSLFQEIARQQPGAFRGIRHLLFGGEAADPGAVREALRTGAPARLLHVYGPTESTSFATWQRVTEVAADAATVPIGHPLDDTEVFVAGPGPSLAPLGAPGELLIGGGGLARGYWRRPDLTAERFVPHPWSDHPGGRLYRTGDRVRRRADGALEFLGRFDQQVKIRGFRVEPDEVAAAVGRHPGVRAAAVLPRDFAPGDRRLVAYVVPSGATPPTLSELRAFLAEILPEPMLPVALAVLGALPLTPNGKVDRRALAAIEPEAARPAATAPRTPTEELLAGIWTEILGVADVGIHDDFFDLGGHSLLATRVMSRLRESFGVELPLSCLFESPRVADLAIVVERASATAPRWVLPPLTAAPRTGAPPLSFAQQRLWFLDQLEPGGAAYNIPGSFRLRGPLDIGVLALALGEIVRRHEALRTTFGVVAREPVQIIAPGAPVRLPVIDLQGLPEVPRADEAARLGREEAGAPFDLTRGPLLRQSLVALAPQDHMALVTMHHIVSDGWSLGVLVQELRALYEAFLEHRPSPLPELPVQYADFAVWQRRWLTGDVLAAELEHWRERLRDAPDALDLPVDRPRPALRTWRGGHRTLRLPAGLPGLLQRRAREAGATLFMILLAAWKALFLRYTGQSEMTVGTPVAGRTHLHTESLIGFFVNTLVLRTDLAGDPTFTELAARVRRGALDAYAHQDLPFERLVEELQPDRDLNRSALFQVMLVLQNAPRESLQLAGVDLTPLESDPGAVKFDLTLTLGEEEGRLGGVLRYAAELFDGTTVERLLGHYEVLLSGAAADPAVRLSELPLLGPAERHELLVEWNDTRLPAASDACVHQIFEGQAERCPEAPAVACAGEVWSYGELNRRANRLALRLRSMGVGPESKVVLCARRSSAAVAGVLGILKAGGAYVPLEADVPGERLAAILADLEQNGEPPIIVAPEELAERLSAHRARPVWLGEVLSTPHAGEAESPVSGVGPGNAVYLIYTSGSSGVPKAVEVEHRQLTNYLHGIASQLGLRAGSGYALMQPLSVDACKTALYPPLLSGGTLHVVPEDKAMDGRWLAAYLRRHELDVLKLAPSHLIALQAAFPDVDFFPREWLILGGEASRRDWILSLRARGGCRILNQYGPTETTVAVLACRIEADLAGGPSQSAPLGRPLPNSRIYVLDAAQKPVAPGAAGEICVAGGGVARGYLARPALTAARFVPDPFADEPGARLYRTGDLGRFMAAGELEFLGRIDHQVKVRGFRVEPGEVEASLCRHPAVGEAVVAGWRGRDSELQLVAYLTPGRGAPPTAESLRSFLLERLPAHMVPSSFVVLEELPRTAHGKLDRRALASTGPAPESPAGLRAGMEAATPLQELLAGIFAEILGRGRVAAQDDFFALGGHSLLATRLTMRVRSSFGVELPLREVFERPTVAGLAVKIEEILRQGRATALPPIEPVGRTGDLPLSFAQQRLWFLDRLEPGSSAYNIPSAFALSGQVDECALAAAYGAILRRHEALRTTFPMVAGQPVQRIGQPAVPAVPVVDLTGLAPGHRQAVAERLTADETRRTFDLAAGPLVRLALLRLGRDEHLALLGMHHIVADGWSIGVMVRELTALYTAFVRGLPSPLPELSVQYADYAVWQRGWLQGEVLQAELGWWRGQLAGAPSLLALPLDRARPAVAGRRGGTRPIRLPAAALARLGREQGVTLFMILLAAWKTLLSRLSGEGDLVVGTPIANRHHAGIEGLIGFFVNTLALRSRLAAEDPFAAVLRQVRESTLEAYAHQDLPFEKLVEELAPERSLAHTPLFQVMLALQNAPAGPLDLPGLRLAPLPVDPGSTKFDLLLSLAERGEDLLGGLLYATDLFDATTIDRMLGGFARLLEAVAATPELPLGDLPLLTSAERHQISVEWNDTQRAEPVEATLYGLFAAQVERSPEAPALTFGGLTLTYRDLQVRARHLARELRDLGVGPEVVVGVFCGRSPEMVIAMLAILEAGGAYLPLSPEQPEERLALLIAEAAVAVLLTQERLALRLPGYEGLRISVDANGPRDLPERALDAGVRAGNLAYVIYTSGSTGRPKGVAVEHRSATALVAWAAEVFSQEDLAGVLASTAIYFDLSVFELFVTLSRGGRVFLVENLLELTRLEVGSELTLVNTVPSAISELLQLSALPASVLTVNLAGEPLKSSLVRQLYGLGSVRRVFNLYGPSEDTTYSTFAPISPDGGVPPIGAPVAGTRVRLLDRRLLPVPLGAAGEIYLGGTGLARGYFAQPCLTADRFLPDPFSDRPGERMYRTGDLARYRSSGTLEYLGRTDHQVKLRGYRIELGEVEAVLQRHPAIREAVVVVRRDSEDDPRLVAYVVPEKSAAEMAGMEDTLAGELRGHLRGYLPSYMIPATFEVLEALPLAPTGKVDRNALPAPGRRLPAETSLAPRTFTEETLAGIWCEVLGLERVGVTESFFALGGHSLLAVRILFRIRQALGADLPLRALFEEPTIAGLAVRIESAGCAPAIPPAPAGCELPLSFAQERLWFLHQLEPDGAAYNLSLAVRLTGRLDRMALAGALSALVIRHEPLRTTFRAGEKGPVQVVRAPGPFPLPAVDLAGLRADLREAEARRLIAGEAMRPFDLARGPVLRALLLYLGPGEHRALLALHHIAGDGWSLDILLREWVALYRSASPGLQPLPLRYADYAAWQRGETHGRVIEEQLSWWARRLSGAPAVLELPMERPRPAVQTSRGRVVERLLPADLCRRLDELGHREGTTLFMSLLAALAAVLHRYTGQDDLVVGTPIAGRTREETAGLIGFFLNTLALRISLSDDPSARALLGRARDAVLAAFDHQDMPFERLLEELRLKRDLSRTPLFQVLLNWLDFTAGTEHADLPDLSIEPLPVGEPGAKFDLELYAGPQGGQIYLRAVFNRELFAPAQISGLLAHLEELLTGMVAGPDRRLSELSLTLSRGEEVRPPSETPGYRLPSEATGGSIPECFAIQAAAHAGRPAVISQDGLWTYAELAREVDRVAHALSALEPVAERVALLFSPGLPMVAAVLGALAAGRTYVPLDPSYPPARLLDILADSRAGVLLAGEDRRPLAGSLAAALPILFFGELPAAPPAWRPPSVPPEALAYLLYTSGSTGRPKGVLQSHRNVLGHIRTYSRRLGLVPADRMLLLATYSFDAAVMDLFGALLSGAALCIWDLKSDGMEGLGSWIGGQAVTVFHATPTVYRAFLDSLRPEERFPALRFVVLGGEEARRRDLERFLETLAPGSGCRLINGLGPTESTLALQRFLGPGDRIVRPSLPVGWPVEETRVHLHNGAGEQPALWGTGELWLCSPHLAVGYWGHPDLTAERFVPDPEGGPGARRYRTGDLARRLPGGELEFLGRADGQVKIRGFRIETGEVEAALAGHPGVREAAVVAREDPGGASLVAYLVLSPDRAPQAVELRAFLSERLPAYMVPAAFEALAALPINPNGKIDRRSLSRRMDRNALPEPGKIQPDSADTFTAPRSPIEELLAGIWADLLQVERVGVHDNFFDLGGHSLLGMRLMAKIQDTLGVSLAVRTLFESPTVCEMAVAIAGELMANADAEVLATVLAEIE